MIAPGNGLIQIFFAVAFVIASGYALGRIHQWYRDGPERDDAYRTGYDCASVRMFDMALRRQSEEPAAAPVPAPAAAVRSTGAPLDLESPVAALLDIGADGPYEKTPVGHARRRIAAGLLDYAVR
jgi:hypothetical protein